MAMGDSYNHGTTTAKVNEKKLKAIKIVLKMPRVLVFGYKQEDLRKRIAMLRKSGKSLYFINQDVLG
jgi:hypothetical protein